MKKNTIILGLFFAVSQLFAQENLDSSKVGKIDYAYYPMIFYTPETHFAFGAGGMLYSRLGIEKDLQPSKVQLSSYYTTNNQYYFAIEPTLYFGGTAKVISESKFIYSKELLKFYGIGNNTPKIDNPDYEIGLFRFYTELGYETSLIKKLHIGFVYEYTINTIIDKLENTELINNEVVGSNGGNTSGFGLLLIVDQRDNVFYPTKNGYYKVRMIFMERSFGSDFTYNRLVFDFRKYYNLGKSNIVAGQVYFESTSGDVPFFKLPALGGFKRMRGYFLGRYRDELYLTWQIEYRKIIWNRIGAVAFFGMGDVAKRISQFNLSQFKYSYGVGLRYVFDEKERLNVRMDLGFGKNTSGIYFSLEEAF
ncbi:MAG: outer membrane protein assembly factor [Melioribacteraceae bacterium]|nr:outer membrane protein assembly factor [Melioribacteraceae bacterium]